MTPTKEWLRLLPKIDLHVHLDGSLKPATALELAVEQGVRLPAADEAGLIPYLQAEETCDSLLTYLAKFEWPLALLQTAEALERAACELVEQTAVQNGLYVEARFAPRLHTRRGLSCDEAIGAVVRGLRRGERTYGVRARAIVICLRSHAPSDNREAVEAAALYLGRGVVAVDLAGDEANYPARLHRETFALAHELGLPVTIHAGEAAGADNVREAIEQLHATRIGHGIRMQGDRHVMELARARGVALELCPISNIQTKASPDWASYPIRDYFDAGLAVTVNTDNLTVSNTTLTREYETIAQRFGFSEAELAVLVRNAARAAFLEPEEKEALQREVDERLTALINQVK